LGNSKKMRMGKPIGLAILMAGLGVTGAFADSLYNDIPPNAYYPNAPDFSNSIPFAEDQVSQFGGLISAPGAVNNATVALRNWGTAAQYAAYIAANPVSCPTATTCTGANSTGFYAPITVTLYNTGASSVLNGDTVYAIGSTIDTQTTDAFIDWRPAPTAGDPNQFTCTDGQQSFNNAGTDQCGLVQLVNLQMADDLTSALIYGVSFATDQAQPGDIPTDSLNLGINPNAPTEGSNPQPDTAYYAAACGSILSPVNCGVGFTADTGWGSIGAAAVAFTPEPATFGLIGFGLLGLGFVARKKKNDL